MISSKTTLTALRSFALAGTVVIFVLGMWSLVILQVVDSRGQRVLATLQPRLGAEGPSWSQFIVAATQGTARTWTLVVTSLITTFTTLAVIVSNRYYWLRMSNPAVFLLEAASTTSTIIAFSCALSLSLSLNAFSTPPLNSLDSADLSFFATLDTLSRGLVITSSVTSSLLLTALIAHLFAFLQQRTREKDTRSFEPTVSALGMSHGFHALHPPPRTVRAPTPTIYDPYRAFRKGPGAVQPGAIQPALVRGTTTKHVGFADEGTWMSRKLDSRWSVSTASLRRIEGDTMRLLEVKKTTDLKKLRRAVPVRPAQAARPGSDVWNGREGVHAV